MATDSAKTEVGSYFIANYPPFSQWTPEQLPEVRQAMSEPPADVPLGLYLHIPFCRRRCKFCYYRVYTDKNAHDVERYVAALSREIELISDLPVMGQRPFRFVYFGGGTPSFLSGRQLTSLVDRLRANINWDHAEEVTFECEPGTLSLAKLKTLKQLGVTRISLGVEHFDDAVLEENGRAHHAAEIHRAWQWIQQVGFDNTNIDLIAGMVGETDQKWRDTVEQAVRYEPDSVTIYQMELPFNTIFSKDVLQGGKPSPVADWATKRAWVDYAFSRFEAEGYTVSSTCTLVRDPDKVNFSYRDNLWHGSDLLAVGVASFGHISGVHYQNHPEWADYLDALEHDRLPLFRAMRLTPHQRLVREMILQMKTGRLDADYFRRKFSTDIFQHWRDVWHRYESEGWLHLHPDEQTILLTRPGLLRVDSLLPAFFEPQFQGVRYT